MSSGQRRAIWPACIVVALAGAANGILQIAPGGFSLRQSDQFVYAATARGLAEGRGLQSYELRPYSVANADRNRRRIDRNTKFPSELFSGGWPLILAGAFRLFGATDAVYQGVNVALYALLAVVVFLFARGIGGNRCGFLAAGLLLCHPTLLPFGFFGGMELAIVVPIAAAALLLYAGGGLASAACAGALLAFAYFARPTAVCFFPLGLLAIFGPGERRCVGRLATFAASLCLLIVGFTALETALSPPPLVPGRPDNFVAQSLLYSTDTYPANSIQFASQVPSWEMVRELKGEVIRKFVRGLYDAASTASEVLPVYLMPFVPLGLLYAGVRGHRSDVYGLLAVLSWAGVVFLASLTFPDGSVRYQLPAGVLLTPFAAAGVLVLDRDLRGRWRRAGLLGAAAVLLLALGLRAITAQRAFGMADPDVDSRALAPEISAACPPGGIVATHDIKGLRERPMIAWYGHRRSVRINGDAAEVNRLLAECVQADVFLTSLSDEAFRPGGRPPEDWIEGYRLAKRVPVQTDEGEEQELGIWVRDGR